MTYRIGRSSKNDIAIKDDMTVSSVHAELVVDDDGRYYLTDRGSRNGTYVKRGGKWKKIRQEYVDEDDKVMFGDHRTTVRELLQRGHSSVPIQGNVRINVGNTEKSLGRGRKNRKLPRVDINVREKRDPKDDLPSGPVEFNPETGEIRKK